MTQRTRLLATTMALLLLACTGDAFSGADSGDDADLPGDAQADGDGGTKLKYDAGDAANSATSNDGEPSGDASDGGGTTGPRRVFTTFTEYPIGSGSGKFNSAAAADAICQAHATGAGLGGTWKAWLSTSTASVASRFTHTGGPFTLIDGTVIANDWSELTSGALQHKINQTETGATYVGQAMWTSTAFNGATLLSTCPDAGGYCAPCNDWTSANYLETVSRGTSDSTAQMWSGIADGGLVTTCSDQMSFFCFEQ